MTHHNPPRNAKRKAAESPEPEVPPSSSRPHRKRLKQDEDEPNEDSNSPTQSPILVKQQPPVSSSALTKHLLGLYNQIQNTNDAEGQSIAIDFLKLPSKKRYADYYAIIKKPIALDSILGKIEREEYEDTDALKADLILMVSNAKKYNEKGSPIYENAMAIQRIVKDYSSDVPHAIKVMFRPLAQKERPRAGLAAIPPKQTPQEAQEDLLTQLEDMKEPKTKRLYSAIFLDAPSKKEYPEYYAFIRRVICLNEIKRNLKKGLYRTWTDFEADVDLVWSNAMAFNEDGSQVYEDAKLLKAAFEKMVREKKLQLGEHSEPHLKVKLSLQPQQSPPTPTAEQQQQPPPTTKIKLHVPQPQPSPPDLAPSPPTPAPPVKHESPVLTPQPLPAPRAPNQVRQSSPLKSQITASPSKSPPNLRPAPPKPVALSQAAVNKEVGTSTPDWMRTNQTPVVAPRPTTTPSTAIHASPQLVPTVRTAIIGPSQENLMKQPLQNIMVGTKRERNLTLIPLITVSIPSTQASAGSSASTPSTQPSTTGLLLTITSTPPPAPSTQTVCLSVPRTTTELILSAYLTKDLTLHGSYTFTVSSNGRKLAPTLWPDSTRRSGTADSITVAAKGGNAVSSVGLGGAVGDAWKFTVPLGDSESVTSVDANCTAFLKRDERGLLVRGERSRTGQAAGEDGGELERVVIIVHRGR